MTGGVNEEEGARRDGMDHTPERRPIRPKAIKSPMYARRGRSGKRRLHGSALPEDEMIWERKTQDHWVGSAVIFWLLPRCHVFVREVSVCVVSNYPIRPANACPALAVAKLHIHNIQQRSAMFGTEGAGVGRGQDLTQGGAFAHVRLTISPLLSATEGVAGVKSYANNG